MRSLAIAALLVTLPTAFAASEIRVVQARPCDTAGNFYAPKVGDRLYGLRVDWTVSGIPNADYIVRFDVANQNYSFRVTNRQTGNHYAYALFNVPLDGSIPARVAVDEAGATGDGNLSNNVISGPILPAAPNLALEYYNGQRLRAQQSFTVEWDGGTINSLAIYLGIPSATETSQALVSRSLPNGADLINLQPANYPVSRNTMTNGRPYFTTVTQNYVVDAFASRINFETMKGVEWTSYNNLPTAVIREREAEPTVESTNSLITAFVARTLPSDFRTKLKPIQAARALFLGVTKEMSLDNTVSYTAANGLANRRGDAATFQRVYQAALRNVGIPARMVGGWSLGTDFGEFWSEVYFPGVGWVPQDVGAAELYDPTGTYAYCFSTLPFLNERTITQRGSNFALEGFTISSLLPGNFVYRGNARFTAYYGQSVVTRG